MSHVVHPTKIKNNCKTLTDKTYSNELTPDNISGKIPVRILKHLLQYLSDPYIFFNPPSTEKKIF